MDPKSRLTEEPELIRKWTVYLVVCGFLAGLGLCLVKDLNHKHQIFESPCTLTHTAHGGGTSAVLCEIQFGSNRLLLASSLDGEQNIFYDGIPLTPPFPPPRS